MTLREKIFKTFLVTIREINEHGGPEEFFKKYPVGGMFYGEGNALRNEIGQEVGTQMTYEKLLECKKHAPYKLWVCADGCQIRGQKLLNNGKPLAASPDPEVDAYEYGRVIGMQMNDKGIDCVLGPAIDMCFDHTTAWGMSNDPILTARIYRQVIRGIRDQGVCATAKHFPGMGTHHINMHLAPGQNVFDMDRWMKTYGYTYKEMFREGVDSVMNTHITLKSYDPDVHDGFLPIATFSEKLTTKLLKEELGFRGPVITDALIMGGMATGDLVAETVQAFKAGADLLLWPPVEAAEAIENAIVKGDIPMSRLEDALSRIDAMEQFRHKALEETRFDTPDPVYADAVLERIVARGISLDRNERKLLPFGKTVNSVLIINSTGDENSEACELMVRELNGRGIQAEIRRHIYDKESLVCWQKDVDALQQDFDRVLFMVQADHGLWSTALMTIWASHLFDKSKKIIANFGSPWFAQDYFPEDPTLIQVNCGADEISVKALAERLCGEAAFTGVSFNPCLEELNV